MTRPTVRLVERRTREVRLPRAEVDFLLGPGRGLIDVVPAFERGRYRLTPRGLVGFLDGPRVRYAIRPKLSWPNLLHLCGIGANRERERPEGVHPEDSLLAALSRELARSMNDVSRGGLVRGYHDADAESPFLRGRLRTAHQLRDAASRAFPDTFHVTESVFDLDAPWNRIPKAVARRLTDHPDLPPDARAELAAAVVPFDAAGDSLLDDAEFDAAGRDPRAAGYAELLRLCRTLGDGLKPAAGQGGAAFLIDLGRLFEEYVGRSLTAALAPFPRWSVAVQPRLAVGCESVSLQPDLIVRRGEVRAVLDAKWKRLAAGPDAGDLHQILAYAAVTGARHVGLVYPGSRGSRRTLAMPNLRVSLFRLQVTGPVGGCEASVRRLARAVRSGR